jgi:hypothetical protein
MLLLTVLTDEGGKIKAELLKNGDAVFSRFDSNGTRINRMKADPSVWIKYHIENNNRLITFLRENWEEEITKRQNKKVVPVLSGNDKWMREE